MENEHKLVKAVYASKTDPRKADELIREYIPFIRSEASKFTSRFCTESDDEYSIAMIAFHEAILGYSKDRGAFLSYASLTIRSRLTDYVRKEARHDSNLSLYDNGEDEGRPIIDELEDKTDRFEESIGLEATKREIEELSRVMADFGVSFSDVADNSPKQERTQAACARAVMYASENGELLDELLDTKKLPLSKLVLGSGIERKTLERHRKYILAMLLIHTNGYEIIRGHIRHGLRKRGAQTV